MEAPFVIAVAETVALFTVRVKYIWSTFVQQLHKLHRVASATFTIECSQISCIRSIR